MNCYFFCSSHFRFMLRRTRKIAVASIHTKKPSNGQEQQECVLLFGKGKNGAFTSTTKRWTNWIWLNGFQSPKENKQQNEQYFLSAHSLFSYCTPVFLRCLFLLLLLFGIFVWCQYRSFNRKHWHCIYKLSINRLQFFQFFVVVVLLHTFVVFDEFFPRFFFYFHSMTTFYWFATVFDIRCDSYTAVRHFHRFNRKWTFFFDVTLVDWKKFRIGMTFSGICKRKKRVFF